ncbi:DUF4153 domain-containing protein [Brevundimonas sp. LM2]|uniref:DUF4153 domain-containing protein n=1 Tax=Brevundimonas sp. LM2 TaxID=1938605 RepID=UPI0009839E1A|nr:DUF4153 domain-containing protein [Brevundimonas sp. LM2]AQR61147.1 DUF4153 domain-containing protein [Brevundimonas sp. LM2]
MTTETTAIDETPDSPGRSPDRGRIALARLAIGLVQGIVLYLLMRATQGSGDNWSRQHPELFAPAVLVALFLPTVLLSGVGRLRLTVYAVWSLIAGAGLALLAWHDVARQAGEGLEGSFSVFVFAAAALFIAHHLVVPADRERRLIAAYPAYFDAAWMAGVQLVLSIGFAAAFWLLLWLGASLFNIIGLSFLGDLLRQGWFALPLTGLAFAAAVQLTDVRDGLIRGVRTVALMLLSWLLLVLTVLVAAFLAALPFTGLTGLWATGSATALVLTAAGMLIVLINAAYQDGRPDTLPPAVLRVAVRVAAILLTPLIVIAAWGLMLRIGQHGLTPDRIVALACAVVGGVYAVGYGHAALRPFWAKGDWMRPLERTNIVTAVLQVAVIMALFTPVADPARLSVADQVARLQRGAVTPEAFDYGFLRFQSGRVGQSALSGLASGSDTDIASRARAAQAADNRYAFENRAQEQQTITPTIEAWPAGSELPAGFVAAVRPNDRRYDCQPDHACVATARDLDADGSLDVILAKSSELVLFTQTDGRWMIAGRWRREAICAGQGQVDPRAAMRAGAIQPTAQRWPDLLVGKDQSMAFRPDQDCQTIAVSPPRR